MPLIAITGMLHQPKTALTRALIEALFTQDNCCIKETGT